MYDDLTTKRLERLEKQRQMAALIRSTVIRHARDSLINWRDDTAMLRIIFQDCAALCKLAENLEIDNVSRARQDFNWLSMTARNVVPDRVYEYLTQDFLA